tara:strand:- start:1220 stop:1351 length:132 start_codon:yes stop_codon:yes gene_type:complete
MDKELPKLTESIDFSKQEMDMQAMQNAPKDNTQLSELEPFKLV